MSKFIVDITKLIKVGITPDENLLLFLLSNNDQSLTVKYINKNGYFSKESILKLESLGLLVNRNNDNEFILSKFNLTESGKDFLGLNTHDNFITHLWQVFPSSTPNGRKLKQCSKKDAEILYNKCHENNKEEHERIIKLLKTEIESRTIRNTLDYMQNLKTWLRNRSYIAYEDEVNNNAIDIYGGKLF